MPDVLRTLRIARVALEAATAFSVGTGRGLGTYDEAVAVDANGLPALPATTLKGVLRHAAARFLEAAQHRQIFGFVEGREGLPARLRVSWGWCHDSHDKPVFGRLAPSGPSDRFCEGELRDPLLAFLRDCVSSAPIVRERVRIDARGVADDRGKFDRTIVPAGTRFTVELSLDGSTRSDEQDDDQWRLILGLLASGDLRFGGGTRGGLGRFEPVDVEGKPSIRSCKFVFDAAGFEAFRAFRRSSENDEEPDALLPLEMVPKILYADVRRLSLDAADTWRFGGGLDAIGPVSADQSPAREPIIEWIDGRGRPTVGDARRLVVAGTSIKGALRHRTAYHHRCRIRRFAGNAMDVEPEADRAVQELFGSVKARPGDQETPDENGRAGLVVVDDCHLKTTDASMSFQTISHVSIDRFTGGARRGALFDEQVVVGGRIAVTIRLLPGYDQLDEPIRNAFEDALNDLREGRLPLGAASARGNGIFLDATG